MSVEGATHVQLNDEGKIYLHRDYYDFATTFTEAIPLFRGPISLVQEQAGRLTSG